MDYFNEILCYIIILKVVSVKINNNDVLVMII